MIEYNPSQNSGLKGGDLSFKVIGVGGSGANVLDRLALEGSDDAQLLVLNTDIRKLSSSVSSQKVQLGATLLKGMGTGGDPNLGKQSAIEAADEIREAIQGYDMVFVCVGLGGGTGSGAAPEVCRIAREEGVFLVAFTTLPFEFEGARRMEQARDALNKIEGYANAVVTFENDRMGELIVPKDGVTQAFAAADKIISQSIRATMNIVGKPGIIRIGMDDLLTALSSTNSRCLFGYGQAKGDNRALDAVEQTLKCPLLDNGKLLSEARNVLVQVSGSDSMTLLEVQTVMKEITSHLKSSAHVLFGTGTDPRLGSSLAVTVISSLDGEEKEVVVPRYQKKITPMVADSFTQSPLAVAVTAAAAAALDSSAGVAAKRAGANELVALNSNIVQMQQPLVGQVDTFEYAAAANSSAEMPDFLLTNPIASAIQEATQPRQAGIVSSIISPRPLTPPTEPHHDAPSFHDRVEARTDQAQTIALSRIVPGQTTQRILSRPAKEGVPAQQLPQLPATDDQFEQQQQDIFQLEPAQSRGRFAKGDPTIVDGEDLDVPTFLRKKG